MQGMNKKGDSEDNMECKGGTKKENVGIKDMKKYLGQQNREENCLLRFNS